jgi:hypothetical protein
MENGEPNSNYDYFTNYIDKIIIDGYILKNIHDDEFQYAVSMIMHNGFKYFINYGHSIKSINSIGFALDDKIIVYKFYLECSKNVCFMEYNNVEELYGDCDNLYHKGEYSELHIDFYDYIEKYCNEIRHGDELLIDKMIKMIKIHYDSYIKLGLAIKSVINGSAKRAKH